MLCLGFLLYSYPGFAVRSVSGLNCLSKTRLPRDSDCHQARLVMLRDMSLTRDNLPNGPQSSLT